VWPRYSRGGKRPWLKQLGLDAFAYLRDTLPALFVLGGKPSEEALAQWLPDAWRQRAAAAANRSATPTTYSASEKRSDDSALCGRMPR